MNSRLEADQEKTKKNLKTEDYFRIWKSWGFETKEAWIDSLHPDYVDLLNKSYKNIN